MIDAAEPNPIRTYKLLHAETTKLEKLSDHEGLKGHGIPQDHDALAVSFGEVRPPWNIAPKLRLSSSPLTQLLGIALVVTLLPLAGAICLGASIYLYYSWTHLFENVRIILIAESWQEQAVHVGSIVGLIWSSLFLLVQAPPNPWRLPRRSLLVFKQHPGKRS